MPQRFNAGAYSGDEVIFELYVSDSNQISRFYCTNNSDQAASGTLVKLANGQIVAQATFGPGESFVQIDGSNPFEVDENDDPIWPFSISTSWPA